MTVPDERSRIDYIGNGVASQFSFPFEVFEAGDLIVYKILVADRAQYSVLAITTDYTIDANSLGNPNGGGVTLVAGALSALYALSIKRVVDVIQELELSTEGNYFPDNVEKQFDRGVMMVQQQKEELDRSLKIPVSVPASTFSPELPGDIVNNPGAYIVVNANGSGLIAATASIPAANVSPYIATLLDDLTAAAARATLGIDGSSKNIQTGDLADVSVTAIKLAVDSVTIAKIMDGNVTMAKLAESVRNMSFMFGTSATGTDAYAINPNPAYTAYSVGMKIRMKLDVGNTGPCTVNVNGLGVKNITDIEGSPLASDELKAGAVYDFVFDGTNFQVQGVLAVAEVYVYAGNGYGSSSTKIRKYSSTLRNVGSAITYASSATLGATFTINKGGIYCITRRDISSSDPRHGVSLNSASLTTTIDSLAAAEVLAYSFTTDTGAVNNLTANVHLNAGDVLRPHDSGLATGTDIRTSAFSIARIG